MQYPGAKRGFDVGVISDETIPHTIGDSFEKEDTQDTKLASDPIRPPVPMQKHGSTVALVGEIPGNLQRDSLGVFNQCAALVNGYPQLRQEVGCSGMPRPDGGWVSAGRGQGNGCLSCYFELEALARL